MLKNIAVVGSWHLASVITGCLIQKGFKVNVVDQSQENISTLSRGSLPIFEPELEDMIKKGLNEKRLTFSNNFESSLREAEIVYFAKDTTKTEDGVDLTDIIETLKLVSQIKKEGFTLIISSQLPVGTCEQLKKILNAERSQPIHIAHVPEFLRLGNAVSLFLNQDYIIIGCDSSQTFEKCSGILSHFSKNIFRMKLSEAELAKHIANCFVATSVSFIAEITKVADRMGVDLVPVSKALRFDKRIGPKSYILPGLGFSGGNVERDIKVLQKILKDQNERSEFLDAVVRVNEDHNQIVFRRLKEIFHHAQDTKIAFLGITYKSFTDTLNGSLTIAVGERLAEEKFRVSAYDPLVSREKSFPHKGVEICPSLQECLRGADAVVMMIEKPEFRDLTPSFLATLVRKKNILDAANMFNPQEYLEAGFKYCAIGRGVTW